MLDHASQGLRTLLICERDLTQSEFEQWKQEMKQAESKRGEAKVVASQMAHEIIERNLNVLGSTAVQDNL